MTDRIEPIVRLPIDPERIIRLTEPRLVGGIRVKTTIYVVEEMDLSNRQTVTVLTAPLHAVVEVKVIE
jgi:hypothetical protein